MEPVNHKPVTSLAGEKNKKAYMKNNKYMVIAERDDGARRLCTRSGIALLFDTLEAANEYAMRASIAMPSVERYWPVEYIENGVE